MDGEGGWRGGDSDRLEDDIALLAHLESFLSDTKDWGPANGAIYAQRQSLVPLRNQLLERVARLAQVRIG